MPESGVDWRVVSSMMGHAGPASSERYTHVPTELEREAARRFDRARNPKGSQTPFRGSSKRACFVAAEGWQSGRMRRS